MYSNLCKTFLNGQQWRRKIRMVCGCVTEPYLCFGNRRPIVLPGGNVQKGAKLFLG